MSIDSDCPICGASRLVHFLERKQVPVQQHQVLSTQAMAKAVARGDMQLAVCENCGFVTNTAFVIEKLQYDETYDNTQTHSPIFSEYIGELIDRIAEDCPTEQPRIVEVGCGKGVFLYRLIESMAGAVGYGFDTSYIGPLEDLDGRIRFFQRYYESGDVDIDPVVIVCRHVIEHVPNPLSLLQDIRKTLPDTSNVKIYFETPCVKWILQNRVIWDFFYEHCSYFSAHTLRSAFELSGFKVDSVEHVFGGQYLWLKASLAKGDDKKDDDKEVHQFDAGKVPELARQFAQAEAFMTEQLAAKMRMVSAGSKVALWGAGAKGVTLANLLDSNGEWITCVVDINPKKQHKYLAIMGHPIVDYHQLPELGVSIVFNMNTNYFEENLQLLTGANIDSPLIDMADWMQTIQ